MLPTGVHIEGFSTLCSGWLLFRWKKSQKNSNESDGFIELERGNCLGAGE